ncbi:hypothetical protein [Bizionia myxarmorum]|uniref:DUF4252 domain-containing protein n=1 Tax=Bizionia myxarmorum TaxID=291186 RepID=A0A5D0R5T5_9FLAO|nr:hypothetical protein [Bizionia myxarmorum]TYB76877.1 hypothetical protein ES674_09205 [Bizionia myxarmorum]
MKTLVFKFLFFGIFIVASSTYAQSNYIAKLEKNTNLGASTLFHELNKTRDTLILKSPSKISRIYAINNDFKREIDTQLDAFNYKLSLDSLSKGKHVLVVSQSPKKIIFVIYILDKLTAIERI